MGHQFMVGKRGKVIGSSIHNNDTVGAGIIRSIIGEVAMMLRSWYLQVKECGRQ
jgi:hypothetical protein